VAGVREAADGSVAVRRRGAGKKQDVMAREAFVGTVVEEIRSRTLG